VTFVNGLLSPYVDQFGLGGVRELHDPPRRNLTPSEALGGRPQARAEPGEPSAAAVTAICFGAASAPDRRITDPPLAKDPKSPGGVHRQSPERSG
jgi:hypothetical protein